MPGLWKPYREAHSIERVAAVVAFPEPLNDLMLRKVLREADKVAAQALLLIREPIPGYHISLNAQALNPTPLPVLDRAALVGIQFKRRDVDGISPSDIGNEAVEELNIERQVIVYRATSYISWTQFHKRMVELLRPLLDVVLTGTNVASVRLEYRDRFNFDGRANEATVGGLLRSGSDLIAPHVFKCPGLWHSHTGMLLEAEGAARRLVQINVDANDIKSIGEAEVRRTVSIVTGVQDFFEVEGVETTEQSSQGLLSHFKNLKEHSHELFMAMMTDEMAKTIGMVTKKAVS